MIITGNYTLQANPNWKLLQLQEIYLECDTTLTGVNITLPEIASMSGFFNVKIYVSDFANNASVNNINIVVSGSDTIDASPSVTINTNGGSAVIAITSPTQWICLESNAGGGSGWSLTGNAGTDPNVNFLGTTDGEKFIIQPSTGNVGIGTTNPKKKLDVVGEFSQVATSGGVSAALQSVVGAVNMSQTDGIYTSQLSLNNTEAQLVYNSGTEINTVQPDANGIALLNNNVENVRLLNNGNVGIGSTGPTAKLDVVQGAGNLVDMTQTDAGVTRRFYINDNDNINFNVTDAGVSMVALVQSSIDLTINANDVGLGTTNTYSFTISGCQIITQKGDIEIRTSVTDDLIIQDGGGNVGIGTATPTEKLDVVGNLALSGTIKGTTLAAYDDDAAAGVGGLSAGDFYQTTGLGAAPLNVAGIVMVKQ